MEILYKLKLFSIKLCSPNLMNYNRLNPVPDNQYRTSS